MITTVLAKVKINFQDPLQTSVIVRKAIRDVDGQFIAKCGLTKTGEWILIAEGQPYPEECRLSTSIFNNFSDDSLRTYDPGGLRYVPEESRQ